MRRWGRSIAAAAIVVGSVGFTVATVGAAPVGPVVSSSCVGIDPGPPAKQIRVGMVVSGADGLYRVTLTGPEGPSQGEGRLAGGRGVVVVPAPAPGDYASIVVTDVDTGQSVDPGSLAAAMPVKVGSATVACDPAALVAPGAPGAPATTEPTAVALGGSTTTNTAAPAPSTPDTSIVAPAATTTKDAPPWLLLLVPGVLLLAGGVVLLIRARPGSHSR